MRLQKFGSILPRGPIGWRLLLLPVIALDSGAAAPPILDPEERVPAPSALSRKGFEMDYGPFISYSVEAGMANGVTNLVLKGMIIKLPGRASVCYDTDTLRLAAAWQSGPLDISKTHLTSYKGTDLASVPGTPLLFTKPGPGWAKDGSFADPRPLTNGPLPATWAKYRGLFKHGEKVALHYTVGETEVWELPGREEIDGSSVFSRTFRLGPADTPKTLRLWDLPSSRRPSKMGPDFCQWSDGTTEFSVLAVGLPSEASLEIGSSSDLELRLPALRQGALFKVWTAVRGSGGRPLPDKLRLEDTGPIENPETLSHGGPAQWTAPVVTRGRRSSEKGPYVVDHLPPPDDNPWKSWMRLTALDFFSDGRAAVSTLSGDVWIVSGIDDGLTALKWKRFAAGLYEPLGLRIVNDLVYVLGRDQITRLRDLNQDGEADSYENFNNDGYLAASYHAFALDLQTDSATNFYYTRCGHRAPSELPLNGAVLKVAPDGSATTVVATGLRAANGLGIGPHDEITCSDNQGNWVPSSRLNWVKPGGFYGYVPHAGRPTPPADFDPPLCWLPMTVDNSSGGQVWVPAGSWGPLAGHLLHTSYGACSLFLVLVEELRGQHQGGVVRLPLQFESGIMRGRFNPRDGQLYLAGLKGWTTRAIRDGAIERVRFTGDKFGLPTGLQARRDGLLIQFNAPLEPASASDPQNYAVEQWNYHWTADYGSPDFSVAHPGEKGHDAVPVEAAERQQDERAVFLRLGKVEPVMQMKIQFRIKAADGSPIRGEIYNTINLLP